MADSKRDKLMADLAVAGHAVGSVSDRTKSLFLANLGATPASLNDNIVNQGGFAPVTTKNAIQ